MRGLLVLVVASLLAIAEDADACGGFFARRAEGARKPSLAYEQTFITFDAELRRENFVREVTFRQSRQRFGFVVPTPSRPEVGAVKQSPFAELRKLFPFRSPQRQESSGYGRGAGGLRGRGSGVQVLEVTKVGSFTAFVLAADDPQALSRWLAQNGLVSTPEADAWLAHYVRMGFFYVAMRYEPPDGAGPRATQAETMRISFDTPLPYYPYFEPALPQGQDPPRDRLLEIWLTSTQRFVPVAARTERNRVRWVQPFEEGTAFERDWRATLQGIVGATFLPAAGNLIVQRFVDMKVSREGFGDVLFVPRTATQPDAALRASLERFLPILDPSLAP